MIEGLYINLTSAELAQMRSDTLTAIQAIKVGAQSYSIAGRTFTKANLKELRQELAEISFAQAQQGADINDRVYADMSDGSALPSGSDFVTRP